ncbi:MAG: response regulator [Deltaproteobacteria bacterium]|nr:response regulator [Deltaproteobacteria bacterium]
MAEEISDVAHQRFRGGPVTLLIEVVASGLGNRLRAERERRGTIPIGCAVAREEECLDALKAGADEAVAITLPDARAIHTLIDRTLLRASLRRQSERISASIGHAEKLAALGTLVAGVAHEINNPLAAVALSVNALELGLDPLEHAKDELERLASLGRAVQPEELRQAMRSVRAASPSWDIRRALADITSGVEAITDVVRDLRVFARVDEEAQPELVDVGDLVDQVLRIVRREIEQTAVLERDIDRDLPPLLVPRTRLAQVLTNVLINAAHAVREVERSVHRVRISARADDEAVAIVVSDTGPGIAPDDIDRIFDPFYTTKRQDLGTGLGLSISRSILRRLGGDMIVDSVHGDGASFLLMVPRPDPRVLRSSGIVAGGTHADRSRDRLAVLIVDTDEVMVRAYSRALGSHHDVIVASDGEEAIELLESGTTADVVLSELGMPGIGGPGLHQWLERERPALAGRTLFVTSSHPASGAQRALQERGVEILAKPISRDALLEAIERATGLH